MALKPGVICKIDEEASNFEDENGDTNLIACLEATAAVMRKSIENSSKLPSTNEFTRAYWLEKLLTGSASESVSGSSEYTGMFKEATEPNIRRAHIEEKSSNWQGKTDLFPPSEDLFKSKEMSDALDGIEQRIRRFGYHISSQHINKPLFMLLKLFIIITENNPSELEFLLALKNG